VSSGLVEKRPRPEDARSLAVTLTSLGNKRLSRALESKGAELTRRLDGFEEHELSTLAGLLHRLNSVK